MVESVFIYAHMYFSYAYDFNQKFFNLITIWIRLVFQDKCHFQKVH